MVLWLAPALWPPAMLVVDNVPLYLVLRDSVEWAWSGSLSGNYLGQPRINRTRGFQVRGPMASGTVLFHAVPDRPRARPYSKRPRIYPASKLRVVIAI